MTESNRESDGILPLYKKGVGGVIRLAARRARAGDLGRRAGRATCAWEAKEIFYLITKIKSSIFAI